MLYHDVIKAEVLDSGARGSNKASPAVMEYALLGGYAGSILG